MNETTEHIAEAGFSNEPVDPASLPDFSTVELTPVARGFLPYSILSSILFLLVLAAAAVVVRWLPAPAWTPGYWIPAALAALTLPVSLYCWLDARRRGWAVREHDLIYRSGVLVHVTTVLPFARIQHVESASGPLERAFGVVRLKCFTAGGMTADLTAMGLDRQQAGRLRAYLLERIRGREA